MSEFAPLAQRVGSADRARLDEHLTGLREVERVLTAAPQAMSSATCAKPADPAAGETMDVTLRAKLFLRLIAVAFRCDLTRYVSFALSNGFCSRTYPDLSTLNNYHQLTHTGGHYGPDPPNVLMKFITYYAGLYAALLGELKSTTEGAGTLLDNCLIYYGSELGEGWHTCTSMPVVLAGRAGGRIVPGRHLVYAPGTPLAKLFLAILQLAGSTKSATFGMGGDMPLDGLTS